MAEIGPAPGISMSDMAKAIGAIPVSAAIIGSAAVNYKALSSSLAAGNRQVSISIPLAVAGDVLSARPTTAIPDGYDIGAAYCVTDGTVVVVINHPALSLLQEFTVNVRIVRIRAL